MRPIHITRKDQSTACETRERYRQLCGRRRNVRDPHTAVEAEDSIWMALLEGLDEQRECYLCIGQTVKIEEGSLLSIRAIREG